ncbi:MAG: tetratricopeptide repeat protein [Taibaiella sp.]|nr:tetratricopeptide repeat protein [Taibaiella sp.]
MDRIDKLKQFLNQSPHEPFLTHALALEWIKMGNQEEALACFESNKTHNPEYVGTYYHLAKLLESLNKNKEAIEVYEAGMEVARKAADTHALNELRAALEDLTY